MNGKKDIAHSLPLGKLVDFVRNGGVINLIRHVNRCDLAITTENLPSSHRVESECSGGDHFLSEGVKNDTALFWVAQFIAELCGVDPASVESYQTIGNRRGYRIIGPKPKRRARQKKIAACTMPSTGAVAGLRATK